MKNIIFDMETGDPDDLITLCMLLNNPLVELRGITCYEGSPIQIGLINHVLSLANRNIPVGGLNSPTPESLSPYYKNVVGQWQNALATQTPREVFQEVFAKYPDTTVITGAPLTNIADVINTLDIVIPQVITQGGYIGALATNPLNKFKGKTDIRTYNLSQDPKAFEDIFKSDKVLNITYVTKDLCHGFMYTPEIHKNTYFGSTPIEQLLKKCLEHYALNGKSKAMHDPLAMLYMLNPDIGNTKDIYMGYSINDKGHALFSSVEMPGSTRSALIDYDQERAWRLFQHLCSQQRLNSLKINTTKP